MKKLTDAEVLAQWRKEKPENVLTTPTTEDLKRMRATMNKRAERARKKVAVDIETRDAQGKPTITFTSGANAGVAAQFQPTENSAEVIAKAVAAADNPLLKETMPVTCALVKMMAADIDETPASGAMTEEEKQECRLDQQDDAEKVDTGFGPSEEAAHDTVAQIQATALDAPIKRRYTMVPVLSGGQPLAEVVVDCFSEKEANKTTWAGLSDAQKDNCEYIDCVDVKDIPAAVTKQVLVAGGGSYNQAVATALASNPNLTAVMKVDASPIFAGLDLASGPDVVVIQTTETKEDEMQKKAKKTSTKKAGKRIPREEIVKSTAFITLFEKAIANSRDPKRTHCKNGHTITAAHAHVGDLKRTGRYTCDLCNTEAQARYNGGK